MQDKLVHSGHSHLILIKARRPQDNKFARELARSLVMVALTRTDMDVRTDILTELRFSPDVEAEHIGVTVDKGVAILTGHVSSYAEKLSAMRAVYKIRGVRAVADEIVVRVPNHKQTADDEIARRVADILNWDSVVPANAIRITVHDGWVNLEGEVDWQYQRAAAQNEVAKLSGLVGLINNITVKNRPRSDDIRSSIESAFRRNVAIHPAHIGLKVREDGTVLLDGDVSSWAERGAAEDIAWSVPGVTAVESHLAVRH
jgi:osmotically-inducible protein OsmY